MRSNQGLSTEVENAPSRRDSAHRVHIQSSVASYLL
jgi:hypothetical protein